MLPRVCLQFVIVLFPDNTHLLFVHGSSLKHICHLSSSVLDLLYFLSKKTRCLYLYKCTPFLAYTVVVFAFFGKIYSPWLDAMWITGHYPIRGAITVTVLVLVFQMTPNECFGFFYCLNV